MSIQLIHNSVLHIHRYWFDWEIGRGKKKKGIVPQVVILFLDMHPKYLYYNDYGFI